MKPLILSALIMITMIDKSTGWQLPLQEELDALPTAPAVFGKEILAATSPLLLTQSDILRGRENAEKYDWARSYLKKQQAVSERFVKMPDAELRALVPKRGALFIHGLSMNYDPVRKERMQWAGWENPLTMLDSAGRAFPNEAYPDDGAGWHDPSGGEYYYFIAQANTQIVRRLEQEILPALADVYLLTQSRQHAHCAAVLLDALAAAYPSSVRGPLDYPVNKELRRFGGRLDRPTQQVARGLVNYVQVIDGIVASGELEASSAFIEGETIRENIARNLLWDGARYCLLFAKQQDSLANASADLNLGAAMAGLLLHEKGFLDSFLSGTTSIDVMLLNNLVRGEFYFETSPLYEFFTMRLYHNSAELIEALRQNQLTDHASLYKNPAFLRLMTGVFSKRNLSGHIPLIGNSRVDIETTGVDPSFHQGVQARMKMEETLFAWTVLLRSSEAEQQQQARNVIDSQSVPEDRWMIWHFDPSVQESQPAGSVANHQSSVFGGKGLGVLRDTQGKEAFGVQLAFGPIQIKSQNEALTWTFFYKGAEWSYDPGYFNTHFRFGWSASSVAHQSLVVNQTNVSPTIGTGFLKSFVDGKDTKWMVAEHPEAYRKEGVTFFDRTIVQVENEQDGALLYWLDIGRIRGGTVREDSFHSQMQTVDFLSETDWQPMEKEALFGDKNLGARVTSDFKLKGEENRPFYWTPPGEGYGFLGNPKKMTSSQPVRTVWKSPAFFKDKTTTLFVDFIPDHAEETFLLAEGPEAIGHPRVPYLIQQTSGEVPGVFVKALRFEETIESVENLKVTASGEDSLSRAWMLHRKDGLRDIWILNEKAGEVSKVRIESLGEIQTNGILTLLRLDKESAPIRILADAATYVRIGEHLELTGVGIQEAAIQSIEQTADGMVLSTDGTFDKKIQASIVNIVPSSGQTSTWSLRKTDKNKIYPTDASPILGGGFAEVAEDGILVFKNELSRFRSGDGIHAQENMARGKAVFLNGKFLGKIIKISDDTLRVELDVPLRKGLSGLFEIYEIAVQDTVQIPTLIDWKPSNETVTE